VSRVVILDTGPLVALLHSNDQYHDWARLQAEQLNPPFLTCEAVLSKAHFLLRKLPVAQRALLELLQKGLVQVAFDLATEIEVVVALLGDYANVPMSVADACLVRLSELRPGSVVFTTDHDFAFYRRHGNQAIPVIMPETKAS
jgi:predicted nucleic acid-binding protein